MIPITDGYAKLCDPFHHVPIDPRITQMISKDTKPIVWLLDERLKQLERVSATWSETT